MERTLSARSCSIHRLEIEMGRLIEIKAKIRHTHEKRKKKSAAKKGLHLQVAYDQTSAI